MILITTIIIIMVTISMLLILKIILNCSGKIEIIMRIMQIVGNW